MGAPAAVPRKTRDEVGSKEILSYDSESGAGLPDSEDVTVATITIYAAYPISITLVLK